MVIGRVFARIGHLHLVSCIFGLHYLSNDIVSLSLFPSKSIFSSRSYMKSPKEFSSCWTCLPATCSPTHTQGEPPLPSPLRFKKSPKVQRWSVRPPLSDLGSSLLLVMYGNNCRPHTALVEEQSHGFDPNYYSYHFKVQFLVNLPLPQPHP